MIYAINSQSEILAASHSYIAHPTPFYYNVTPPPPIIHTPNASYSQDSTETLFHSWVFPTQTKLFLLHKAISLYFAHEALSPWIDLLILDIPRFNIWSPPLHYLHSLLWWVIQSHSLKYHFFAKDSEIDLSYPVFFPVSET